MPRISELPALAQATSGDIIPIVDDAGNITKKVTANKVVPDGSVVATQLGSNAVTTAKIGDGQVTASKLDFSTISLLSSNATVTSIGTSLSQINGMTGSITVSAPTKVRITLSGNLNVGQSNASMQIDVRDGATVVMTGNKESNNSGFGLTYTRVKDITLTSGTHNFTVWARMAAGTSGQFAINDDAQLLIDRVS